MYIYTWINIYTYIILSPIKVVPLGGRILQILFKKVGGGLQNPKQGSDPTLHSLQNGNPNGTFFGPLFPHIVVWGFCF